MTRVGGLSSNLDDDALACLFCAVYRNTHPHQHRNDMTLMWLCFVQVPRQIQLEAKVQLETKVQLEAKVQLRC